MFIIKWWRYCRGYLVISLSGRGVERLLNLAIARGINFWDLHKKATEARLSIDIRSFKILRPLVRQTRCKLQIRRKTGLPFWKWRLRRRWGLVLGVLFFFIAMYISTSLVWQVRVTGTKRLEPADVLALAGEMGIKQWAWRRSLDLPALEEELVRRHVDIVWAGIRLRGTIVEIEIVEHLREPQIEHGPADLVASKDGLIIRILALEGEAAVAPGDTVAKGDLLIRGVKHTFDPLLSPDQQPQAAQVRAKGEVKARVWYEEKAPLLETVLRKVETGNSQQSYLLLWPEGSLRLLGPAHSPFANYKSEIVKWRWQWRNLSPSVELVKVVYREILLEEKSISRSESLQQARREAMAKLKALLPAEAEAERLYFRESKERSQEWVHAVAETVEDIAEIRLQGQ